MNTISFRLCVEILKRKGTTYGISHMLYNIEYIHRETESTVVYSLLPSVAQETYNCPNFQDQGLYISEPKSVEIIKSSFSAATISNQAAANQ